MGSGKGDFQLLGFHSFFSYLHPEPQQAFSDVLFFFSIPRYLKYCSRGPFFFVAYMRSGFFQEYSLFRLTLYFSYVFAFLLKNWLFYTEFLPILQSIKYRIDAMIFYLKKEKKE